MVSESLELLGHGQRKGFGLRKEWSVLWGKGFGGKTIPAEGRRKWGAAGLKGSGGIEQGQTLWQATKTEVLVAGRCSRALR